MQRAQQAIEQMLLLADPQIAEHSQRFFQTYPGGYGEGDRFLGIRVPQVRKLAARGRKLTEPEVLLLLHNEYHEVRMLALLILVAQFDKGAQQQREKIYSLYLNNTHWINNWDLVDCSCHKIVGPWLLHQDKQVLTELARSANLWERRIAVISTLCFISHGQFETTLHLAALLLNDPHDLIHKAVGWMLREVGNRDLATEERFLLTHYHDMPRTMLRYAIEKFPQQRRKAYLQGAL